MKAYFFWLAKFLTVVFVFFFLVPVLLFSALAGSASKLTESAGIENLSTTTNKVAVIELNGIIEDSKDVVAELYKQAFNKSVKGIVLRINSPGGAVGPSQEIYSAVADLKSKKPIVASMGAVAASGGLYSALSASKVFAQPGTLTGSIGVIMQIPNFQKAAQKLGVDFVTVKSGKFKDVGNSFRDMTPEEQAFVQKTVDEVQQEFVDAVISGRKLKREKVLEFSDGRVIVGSKALEYGLVDKIGGVHDAAREIFEILKTPLKDNQTPQLYYPEDKFRKFAKYFESILNFPISLMGAPSYYKPTLMYL